MTETSFIKEPEYVVQKMSEFINVEDHIFLFERKNPYMEAILAPNCYSIKKKAIYLERLFCGLLSFDNVYKLFVWNEDLVESQQRLICFK
jgi:hypothetical protein